MPSPVPHPPHPLPLDGIRVLDLTWVIAGPNCSRQLADFGAEVIKLESERSMDPGRMGGPWLHGVNTVPDGGGTFTLYNRNKVGANLNLKQAEGKELFKRLVALSDVIINNYRAGTMDQFGLGWNVLREVNPRLVMAEMSGMGQEGPYSDYVAYGHTLLALAGSYELTGYAEGTPIMPGYTYSDFASPFLGTFAVMSALIERERSGLGQYIDLSQLQMTSALFAESQQAALLGLAGAGRRGNREMGYALHGVFRCAGEDSWCVIVLRDEREWATFRKLAEDESLPRAAGDCGIDELEAAVERWTMGRSSREVMELLQGAGIEAGRVQSAREMVDEDEHLRARQYLQEYDHLLGERALADGPTFRLSATPGGIRRAGPVYGGDNEYVFGEVLGLDSREIRRLQDDGVIQ